MLYEGVNVNTQQSSESNTIPAPVGGLNGRDSLANMDSLDAYHLDNIFPGTATCKVRQGCTVYQAASGGPVMSLDVYASSTQQNILAFQKPYVYDVTVSGTKTALKSNLVSDETITTMFSTAADSGQWLIITTGSDVPMSYNGTALANLTITGLNEPAQGINFVLPYMQRLFFGMTNKLGFYYLPPGQIQGVAEWFDLGQASKGGGYLQAIATFSTDAGDGPDEYIVFISSRGEYFMYQGIDPGDPNNWALVGRYRGSEPIGKKCTLNYAGDLLVLTTQGVEQFSETRKWSDTNNQVTTLSGKLGNLLLNQNNYRDVHGWCMILWPVGGMLIVNVPNSVSINGDYYDFVMNTATNSWARFLSPEWNPLCWCMSNKLMYFGRNDGSIRQVGGQYDNNGAISFTAKQAYNYFNSPQHKHFKWAQFLVRSEAPVVLSSRLSVDYVENAPAAPSSPIGTGAGGQWDTAYWDVDSWGVNPYTQRWIAPYGDYGVAGSHWLIGNIAGASLEWFSTEHVFEKAQGLL